MDSFLNLHSISLVSGLVSFTLAMILTYASKRSKTYDGFTNWVLALLLNSYGTVSVSMQDVLHPILSISMANFALILYLILIHLGFRQFFNLSVRKWLPVYMVTIILHSIWYTIFTYILPSAALRMSFGFLIYAFYSIDSMRQVLAYSKRVIPQRQWLFISMFGLVALWLLFVVGTVFFAHEQAQHFVEIGIISSITLIVVLLANILGTFGMILINNQRLFIELSQSNDQVQQLSKLLPICANCKKIRDDSGYWDHLEGYLSEHTSINLSHSICPDCMQKLYPDLHIHTEENDRKRE